MRKGSEMYDWDRLNLECERLKREKKMLVDTILASGMNANVLQQCLEEAAKIPPPLDYSCPKCGNMITPETCNCRMGSACYLLEESK